MVHVGKLFSENYNYVDKYLKTKNYNWDVVFYLKQIAKS